MPLFLLRRLLAAIPVLAVVAVIVFALLHLSAGDPAIVLAGDGAKGQRRRTEQDEQA